ncbi:FAD binding domain-containing protein [Brevibacterium sp. NPDC049920]|uniref:FAD binding domain-containing protein n=1 Tax=Brevibacterium sp. NPDC049920 TaxID=3155279 RepID=UPI00340F3BE0
MKPAPFTLHRPRTLAAALELLAELGPDAKVLAGGQSLVPVLNMRLAAPAHLVDITALPDVDRVESSGAGVTVGALATHRAVEHDAGAHEHQPLLRQALTHVAHPAIRNRGTVVGSLAHADPNGEMPMILALTEGHVRAVSSRGEREIPAAELFVGPLETCLEPDEILVSATFGAAGAGARTGFDELARRSGDYALAGVGMVLATDGDGAAETITGLSAGFVSVTDLPERLVLDEHVAGTPTAEAREVAEAVAAAVREHIDPIDDIHATSDYRRHLAGVIARRTFTRLARTNDRPRTQEAHA